jgi:hypothetical protein
MAEEAAELGRRAARPFIARGVRPRVRDLAAELGLTIEEQSSPPPPQPRLRSEYRADASRIILYRDTIDAAFATLSEGREPTIARDLFDDLHVAHELFHHLEAEGRVEGLAGDASEQAAHAFARELLDLRVCVE